MFIESYVVLKTMCKVLTIFCMLICSYWCDVHSISINACEVLGARAGVQVFRRELHTHIYLY